MLYLVVALLGSVALISGGSELASNVQSANNSTATQSVSSPTFPNPSTPDNVDSYAVVKEQADVYRVAEYENQSGLEKIHAAEAYAALSKNGKAIAGDDVKIAILSNGARATHEDIAANLATSGNYNYFSNNNDFDDVEGQGTNMASIVAGVKNGDLLGTHGVAYNAKLLIGDIYESKKTSPKSSATSIANGINGVVDLGAQIIVVSTSDQTYSAYDGGILAETINDQKQIDALLQAKNADVLVVAAIGGDADNNANGQTSAQSATYLTYPKPSRPALFANNADLAGYVLAVGAVKSDLVIEDKSNNCTVARQYCLMAPGSSIKAATVTSDTAYVAKTGAQAAAAHVAGAAAILKAAWPFLSANQISQILLNSATDLGQEGVDDVYGHGLLNIYAAVQAQGKSSLPTTNSLQSFSYNIAETSLVVDSSFGDAFTNNVLPQLRMAQVFDDYGRNYNALLAQKITVRNNGVMPLTAGFANNHLIALPLQNRQDFIKVQFGADQKSMSLDSLHNVAFAGSGLSFSKQISNGKNNFFNKTKITIAGDIDEYSFVAGNYYDGSLLMKPTINPYAALAQVGSGFGNHFWQFFVEQNLFKEKYKVTFAYQNGYAGGENLLTKLKDRQNKLLDLALDYNANESNKISLAVGELNEFAGNFLNSKATGAFANSSDGKTQYLRFAMKSHLFDELYLSANIADGISKIKGSQYGVFRSYSNVKSKSAALSLIYDAQKCNYFKGKWALTYAEPLRVYKGSVDINIPIGRDVAGNVNRYQTIASLVPQGKQQNWEISYVLDNAWRSDDVLNLNFTTIKEAGNIKRNKDQYLWLGQYKILW